MTTSRKNTFVVWKDKDKDISNQDYHYGHDPVLRTEEEANKLAFSCNDGHKFAIYQTVTLSNEQLQGIEENTSSLEQFNPFSPKVIKYKQEIESFKTQKEIFSQGLFLGNSKKTGGEKNESPLE